MLLRFRRWGVAKLLFVPPRIKQPPRVSFTQTGRLGEERNFGQGSI
jgi:hypothetical protein